MSDTAGLPLDVAPAREGASSNIAVVGMACRFPGAPTIDAFWQNLTAARDSATTFSDQELLAAGVDPEVLSSPRYVKVGQVIPDVDLFDAEYFGITADEAEILDPQQRQFLECAVEALETAGYDPAKYQGAVGVYAGVGMNTYLLNNLIERYRTASLLGRYRFMLANEKDFLATRVSYKLGLQGPSIGVSTACSSSLVAVHVAVLGLLSGDCDIALAGAVHVHVPQATGYLFQDGMILSPDGRCRAFDRRAQGTLVGNGAGIVVLKRLEDALRDADSISAVIRGTAINNDGNAKAGFTAPSVQGQAAVIAEAQRVAACDPSTVSYVEAHGTGTPLGDPVEVAALIEAFSRSETRASCALGSVKTNIGHLDTASGIAGLIKACLMLDHKSLVPSLHFEALHPAIDLANTPFFVNTELRPWPSGPSPRRAGVSSFGIGGTNAHVVVEEAPPRAPVARSDAAQLIVLSARSQAALDRMTGTVARFLRNHPDVDLADVAFTLAVGRRSHPYRRAVVCRGTRDASMALALGDPKVVATGHAEAEGRLVNIPASGDPGSLIARLLDRTDRVSPQLGPESTVESLLTSLGNLWVRGVPVDWPLLYKEAGRRRIPLPTYPFERKRYWIEPPGRQPSPAPPPQANLRSRLEAAQEAERLPLMIEFLQGVVTGVLGPDTPPPAPDKNLFDLGLDSLILIEMAAKLSDELGSRVPASALVEYPNIGSFGRHLLASLGMGAAVADAADQGRTSRRAALRSARKR